MVIKIFSELPRDEQDDFATACTKHRLTPNDFRCHVEEAFPVTGVGHIHRVAYVQRITNEIGRKYAAGSGTSWTMDFENELIGGIFD